MNLKEYENRTHCTEVHSGEECNTTEPLRSIERPCPEILKTVVNVQADALGENNAIQPRAILKFQDKLKTMANPRCKP